MSHDRGFDITIVFLSTLLSLFLRLMGNLLRNKAMNIFQDCDPERLPWGSWQHLIHCMRSSWGRKQVSHHLLNLRGVFSAIGFLAEVETAIFYRNCYWIGFLGIRWILGLCKSIAALMNSARVVTIHELFAMLCSQIFGVNHASITTIHESFVVNTLLSFAWNIVFLSCFLDWLWVLMTGWSYWAYDLK